MTKKEKRTLAKRLAQLETALNQPDLPENDAGLIVAEMTNLALKVTSIEEMDEIDEMVQEILAKNS